MMLQVDDNGVTPPGEVIITWGEIAQVSMVTTNPEAGDDAFFVLVTKGGRRQMIPHNTPMSDELLSKLQQLPGFDNGVFIEAMAATEPAEYVVWKLAGVNQEEG